MCGTDEYGNATETQTLKEGITPKELCDKYNLLNRETYDWFAIELVVTTTYTPPTEKVGKKRAHEEEGGEAEGAKGKRPRQEREVSVESELTQEEN